MASMAPVSAIKVSVIVPTYNRGHKLGAVLDHVLASDPTGLGRLELIVVDDGSELPAADVVAARVSSPSFEITTLRQDNRGPASARNAGFRRSRGELVLFIDDDILVPPGLIRQHFDAHTRNANAVVFGLYPLIRTASSSVLIDLVERLWSGHVPQDAEFVEVGVVSSGQVSFPRGLFAAAEGIYRDDLRTPVAEEYELSARLRRRGVRILLATEIVAAHDRDMNLEEVCRQQHRNGRGCAEAAFKYPETLALPELARILRAAGPRQGDERLATSIKKTLADLLMTDRNLRGMVRLATTLEKIPVPRRVLEAVYRIAISFHFRAGVLSASRRLARPYERRHVPC